MFMPFSTIIGTGSYLPPRCVTNHMLAAELAEHGIETSDEWIVSRSGIKARHFADRDMPCSDLATIAARRALEAAAIDASAIDLIIVATSTPDMVFPSTLASSSRSSASAINARHSTCRRCVAASSMR